MSQVVKILEYRRARFNASDLNLESLIRRAWGQFPTHTDRAVPGSNRSTIIGLRARDEGRLGFFLHGARFSDGQGIGTIPMRPATEVNLGERQPDIDENFLRSDFVSLIRGNHIICLGCGMNGSALRSYLSALFKKANFPENTGQFELLRVGNPESIKMIKKCGVKSVDLRLDISDAFASNLADEHPHGGISSDIIRAVGEGLASLFKKDTELRKLRKAERGSVTVSINVDKRDITTASDGLDYLASAFLRDEEAEGYAIYLRDKAKTKITPYEMTVKKAVKLEAQANFVSVFQAWDAMRDFMSELEESGQLML